MKTVMKMYVEKGSIQTSRKDLPTYLMTEKARWEEVVPRNEKRKDKNTAKYEWRESVGFSAASLFPTRKWEAVTQGDRPPKAEEKKKFCSGVKKFESQCRYEEGDG